MKKQYTAPYPGRLNLGGSKKQPVDYMSILSKLEVNIPLLQALQIPPLGMFVKDFSAGKAKGEGRIVIGESVSAIIQKKPPIKSADPGTFTLPIWIGDMFIENAMCDLGTSINVMPLSIFKCLKGVELVETRVVIQLADRSCIYPEGMLENVLLRVNEFLYPADFYVIKMNESSSSSSDSSGVFLGRPFLRTAKTVINVFDGTICLECHGEKFTFNVDKATQKLLDVENAQLVDAIDPFVQG